MANKKQQEPKINPGRCMRNLQSYHESIIGLYTYAEALMDFIPEKAKIVLREKIDSVKEFHRAE